MARFFSKLRKFKKNYDIEVSFVDDERREAARILASFFQAWQEEWAEAKKVFMIEESAELKFYENDQRTEVLRDMAKVLCDWEFDNGEEFKADLKEMVENLRPTYLRDEWQGGFIRVLSALLKRYIGDLVRLEEKRLKFEEPSLSPEVALRILKEELGIQDFEFIEEIGETRPALEVEFSEKLVV